MKPAICTQCGGIIEVDETKEAGICSACGTAFITEKVISNYITNNNTINNITNINYGEKNDGEAEFSRAVTRVKLGDFDAADTEIQKAIQKAPENPKFWLYSVYINTEKFTRLPEFWHTGEINSKDELVKCISEVGNFFALADEDIKKSLSAELSINLSSELSFFADYIRHMADAHDKMSIGISLYHIAKAMLVLSDKEDRENVTDAIAHLILKSPVVDDPRYASNNEHNNHLYSLCARMILRVSEAQRIAIGKNLNVIKDGHRLEIAYADFYEGYKDGFIRVVDKNIDHVSMSLYGSGASASLYVTPNIKSIYTAPKSSFWKIEYDPGCSPDSVSRFFANAYVHIIPAEWQTFSLRQKEKGFLPWESILYFKGNTEIKAAVVSNNFSDKQHIIHPLVIQNGKFGKFYHNIYPQCNTREHAESLVKKYFPKEYESGELVYEEPQKKGCYVATAVYGSYDCPEVWTLRRYRDNKLATTWLGRAFIRIYYAISPTLVRWFGKTKWFNRFFKSILDKKVRQLNERGVDNTAYNDRDW